MPLPIVPGAIIDVAPTPGRDIATVRVVMVLTCSDCGRELNRTIEMTVAELQSRHTQLALSGPLASGPCPNGCRTTFSDLNLNVTHRVVDVETGRPVDYRVFKWLEGHFYADDAHEICACTTVQADERYQSQRYGVMHGCGRWLAPGAQRFLEDGGVELVYPALNGNAKEVNTMADNEVQEPESSSAPQGDGDSTPIESTPETPADEQKAD